MSKNRNPVSQHHDLSGLVADLRWILHSKNVDILPRMTGSSASPPKKKAIKYLSEKWNPRENLKRKKRDTHDVWLMRTKPDFIIHEKQEIKGYPG